MMYHVPNEDRYCGRWQVISAGPKDEDPGPRVVWAALTRAQSHLVVCVPPDQTRSSIRMTKYLPISENGP